MSTQMWKTGGSASPSSSTRSPALIGICKPITRRGATTEGCFQSGGSGRGVGEAEAGNCNALHLSKAASRPCSGGSWEWCPRHLGYGELLPSPLYLWAGEEGSPGEFLRAGWWGRHPPRGPTGWPVRAVLL